MRTRPSQEGQTSKARVRGNINLGCTLATSSILRVGRPAVLLPWVRARHSMISPIGPRAILLDLDGTLADSLSVMRLAYRGFLEQFDVEPTDAEFNSLNGPTLSEVVRRLKVTHTLEGDEGALLASYFDVIDRAYDAVLPFPGARNLLQKAREKRCMIGIVTSNSTKRTQAWLDTVGLSNMIDFIVSGDEVKYGKPQPEPYLLAIERTSCPSFDIVAVEDSPQGARSAIEAGLRTFVLTDDVGGEHLWPQGVVPIRSLDWLAERLW